MQTLTDEQLIYVLENQIPDILKRRPELEYKVYNLWADAITKQPQFIAFTKELRERGYYAGTFQSLQI